MTKRSRYEIFASIIQSAAQDKDGMILTKLMYNTFLSYTQLTESLQELTKFELLLYQFDSKKFKVTEKGRRFLHLVGEMDDFLKVNPRPNEIINK